MKLLFFIPILFGCLSCITMASESIALAQELAIIKDAKPIKRFEPKYPIEQARKGVDGWVRLSFVVEPNGKTSNVLVEDSSGVGSFEREALKAVKKWQYEPATENGKAIQQCQNNVRLSFAMGRAKLTVSKKFYRLYDKLAESLDAKDDREIKKYAEKIINYKIRTLEENQYKYTILADYAEYLGDKQQQLTYLNEAADFSGAYSYLKHRKGQEAVSAVGVKIKLGESAEEKLSAYQKRKFEHVDSVLFPIYHKKMLLELDAGLVSEALATVDGLLLLQSASKHKAAYNKQKTLLTSLIQSDKPIVTPANIADKDFWQYNLVRNKFQLTDINGRLTKLDVRCRNKRHVYTVDDRSVWQLPEKWQGCGVYIYGEDNTQFKLVELPSVQANQGVSDS